MSEVRDSHDARCAIEQIEQVEGGPLAGVLGGGHDGPHLHGVEREPLRERRGVSGVG